LKLFFLRMADLSELRSLAEFCLRTVMTDTDGLCKANAPVSLESEVLRSML
jgi:hypothetical protein